MAHKTGNNNISGTLTDSLEILTPNSGFSMMTSSIINQMIATTIDYQKLQDWRQSAPVLIAYDEFYFQRICCQMHIY